MLDLSVDVICIYGLYPAHNKAMQYFPYLSQKSLQKYIS